MTPAEAAALLTVAASLDNRKPDEDAAKAWALVLDGLSFIECRDAIIAHYRASRDWIMPADIVNGVRRERVKRWDAYYTSFGFPVPPARLADDPQAGNRWIEEQRARIMSGEITRPGQIEEGASDALTQRDVTALGLVGRKVPTADYAKQAEATRAKLRAARAIDDDAPAACAALQPTHTDTEEHEQ